MENQGPTGGAPAMPKLVLSRLKSIEFTTQSPVKSARASYPGSGVGQPVLPNALFRMVKSVALTTLSLLASPALINPISALVTPEVKVRLPALARKPGVVLV